jgi:site-specific recombinase XerD
MDAVRLLHERLADLAAGRPLAARARRTRFEDLADLLLRDYRVNGRRSLDRQQRALAHLAQAFQGRLAQDITAEAVSRYVDERQAAGGANATINRELAALKRMYSLGRQCGLVTATPAIRMLEERNVRTGFVEPSQWRALLRHAPADLRPLLEVAYITGWRIRSELLTRRWPHVDFQGGWL